MQVCSCEVLECLRMRSIVEPLPFAVQCNVVV